MHLINPCVVQYNEQDVGLGRGPGTNRLGINGRLSANPGGPQAEDERHEPKQPARPSQARGRSGKPAMRHAEKSWVINLIEDSDVPPGNGNRTEDESQELANRPPDRWAFVVHSPPSGKRQLRRVLESAFCKDGRRFWGCGIGRPGFALCPRGQLGQSGLELGCKLLLGSEL